MYMYINVRIDPCGNYGHHLWLPKWHRRAGKIQKSPIPGTRRYSKVATTGWFPLSNPLDMPGLPLQFNTDRCIT